MRHSLDYLAVEVGRFRLRAIGRMAIAVVLLIGLVLLVTGGIWRPW